jgi:membrane protein DedA with SNARE-associated domain
MNFTETVRLLIGHYGYLVLVVGVLAENTGVPLPGEVLIVLTAYMAADLNLSPVNLILAAALGAFLGDNFAYAVGRKGGHGLINFYCKATFCPRHCAENTVRFFDRFGVLSVALARFFPGIRAIAAPAAGMMKMPWIKFAVSDGLGSFLWATVFVTGGWFFGELAVSQVERLAHFGSYALFGLIVLVVVLIGRKYVLVKRSGLLNAEALGDQVLRVTAGAVGGPGADHAGSFTPGHKEITGGCPTDLTGINRSISQRCPTTEIGWQNNVG